MGTVDKLVSPLCFYRSKPTLLILNCKLNVLLVQPMAQIGIIFDVVLGLRGRAEDLVGQIQQH